MRLTATCGSRREALRKVGRKKMIGLLWTLWVILVIWFLSSIVRTVVLDLLKEQEREKVYDPVMDERLLDWARRPLPTLEATQKYNADLNSWAWNITKDWTYPYSGRNELLEWVEDPAAIDFDFEEWYEEKSSIEPYAPSSSPHSYRELSAKIDVKMDAMNEKLDELW